MAKHYFHFTLGPVQGFVAQARRTRDFWAGSFLLSWLSGVAMNEVKRQGGTIAFPLPTDDYLSWINGTQTGSTPPRQGGIPNRFKAISAEVPQHFDGSAVAEAIRSAWQALAEHVCQKDNLASLATEETRNIWLRQHGNFWEISWAVTDNPHASALLDQRKNWRSHFPHSEGGIKCMVMDGWQELSGVARPGNEIRGRESALKTFWQTVRHSGARAILTDLAEGEHLCALAYVKRRFVHHFSSFKTALPTGLSVCGWPLQSGIPSVSYMAAVHWLEKLTQIGHDNELQAILEAASLLNPNLDERESRIRCLQQVSRNENDKGLRRRLLALEWQPLFRACSGQPTALRIRTGFRCQLEAGTQAVS